MPFIIMLFVMRIFPVGWSLVMSFTNYTGFNYNSFVFSEWTNYLRMINGKDPFFFDAIKSTLIIVAFMVPMQTLISFSYALLLNHDLRGNGLYRTVFYMPAILPIIVTSLMWKLMFTYKDGVFTLIYRALGYEPLNWLGQTYQRSALFVMLVWSGGSGMLTYLAGLKNIPVEQYEAGTIDGAGAFNKFRHITLPTMTPIMFFNIVNGLVASFQIFQQPVLLAQGAGNANLAAAVPAPTNYTYVVHAYQQFFQNNRFGYGLALVWVLFIVSIIVTRLIFWSQKFWVHYETDMDANAKRQQKANRRLLKIAKEAQIAGKEGGAL